MRILILCIGLSCFGLNAQQPNLDSLLVEWNNTSNPDSTRLISVARFIWNGGMYYMPDQVRALAEDMYALATQADNKRHMAGALYTIASIDHSLYEDYESAISLFNQSLKMYGEYGDKDNSRNCFDEIARSYVAMGKDLEFYGEYEEANKLYEEALETSEKGSKKYDQLIYNGIGLNFLRRGLYEKSLAAFNKAQEIEKKMNLNLASTYNNIGAVYNEQGNFDKALTYFELSLKEEIDSDNKSGIASSYNNLAAALEQHGEMDEALEYYWKSYDLFKEIDDYRGVSTALNNIGFAYRNIGKVDSAIHFLQESLSLAEKAEDLNGIAIGLDNIGLAYADKGNYSEAAFHMDKALEIAKSTGSIREIKNSLRSLANLYLKIDSLALAEKYSQELIEYRKQDIEINFSLLAESEKELYAKEVYPDFEILDNIALKDMDNDVLMKECYNNSILLKGLFLKSSLTMKNAIHMSNDSSLISLYEDWIDLKKYLAKIYSMGYADPDAETEAIELEKNLIALSQEFSDVMRMTSLRFEDVNKELKPGEAAIEFIRINLPDFANIRKTNAVVYCALILRGGFTDCKMVKLCTEDDLAKILGIFPGNNQSFINNVYGTNDSLNNGLYELVWNPISQYLEGVENVIISPVGLLHKISFAALGKDKTSYLSDIYNLELKSSTSKIALPEQMTFNQGSSIALFGGVDYGVGSSAKEVWSYLEGSLSEVKKIKNILGDRKVIYYIAKEASEENFKLKAPSSNVLHIATHGFFYPDPDLIRDEIEDKSESEGDLAFRGNQTGIGVSNIVNSKNPLMRSGLALSGANSVWNTSDIKGEDGVLTAAEVATIDMRNTDLVVLSACETGLGDIKGAEGVYGLQRSFKIAGVKYIIMSLWQVPDKETAEFMTTFYKHLTKTNDIKESFKLTQKAMRQKYDPYYWAAFVLVE